MSKIHSININMNMNMKMAVGCGANKGQTHQTYATMKTMSRNKAVVSPSTMRAGGKRGRAQQQRSICMAKREREILPVTLSCVVGGRHSWRATMPIRQNGGAHIHTHKRMIAMTSSASDFGSFSSGSQADESSSESVSNYGQESFSRMNVRDPYRRLGVGKDATFDEIKEARNYLMELHGGDERSRESIEHAYDKIVNMKLNQRKSGKINILGRDGPDEETEIDERDSGKFTLLPEFVQTFFMRFQMPEMSDLLQRAGAFLFLSAWSVMQATQAGGPAFQVAVAFFLGCYWANKNQLTAVGEDEAELIKSVGAAFLFLVIGWFLGATIPALLPIMPKAWTMETGTALFIFASMFVESAFFQPVL